MILRAFATLTVAAHLLACAGGDGREPQPAPGPLADDGAEQSDPKPAGADEADEEEPIDLTLAKRLVAEVEAQWPSTANHPLRTPRNLEDIEKILKLDQVTLFTAGVELARTLGAVEALALEAQIELAWGESYLVLMEVMLKLNEQLEREVASLSERKDLDPAQREQLQSLREAVRRMERLADAFQLLSIEHSTLGSARANELIKKHPNSYLGYRVAADFYRMVRDWKRFGQMVGKIEQLNPKSNGLVFLRGTAAFLKDGDPPAAASWFRQALRNDPDFVRAQVHLLLIQRDMEGTHTEYQSLKKLNPDHQIVHWAGESIELAYRLHR